MLVTIDSPALWLVEARDIKSRVVEGHPTLVLAYAEATDEYIERGQKVSTKGLNFGGRTNKLRDTNVIIQHGSQKNLR